MSSIVACSLQNDRQRQEQLARRRLEQIRKKKGQKIQDVDSVIKKGDRTVLQDTVLQRLDEKHQKERLLLVNLLSQKPDPNVLLVAQATSELERQERQNVLRDRREEIAPGSVLWVVIAKTGMKGFIRMLTGKC